MDTNRHEALAGDGDAPRSGGPGLNGSTETAGNGSGYNFPNSKRNSFSAGVAELKPEDDPTTFFERADEALYAAKERGKAQVVVSNAAS